MPGSLLPHGGTAKVVCLFVYLFTSLFTRLFTYLFIVRSTSLIIDAIPPLLEKLENIIYIDVAEQALSALELLAAQKHALDVLECGGVSTVLQYYEFFSVNAKRSALNVAANCCTAVTPQNFPRVANGLTILTQCLNPHVRNLIG